MAALDGTEVALPKANARLVGAIGAGLLSDAKQLALLSDRADGVFMLSEALNAGSSLGEFLQLWRFFERAFHRGHAKVGGLLYPFLDGCPHGFEQVEIDEWVTKRNPAVHADRNQEPIMDSDVQGIVGRMKECAYEVLLNKADWASPTVTRRNSWKAACGSTDRHGGVFITQGKDVQLGGRLLDDFAAFPLLLAGPVEDVLPKACWLLPDTERGSRVWLRGSGALHMK